MTIGNPLPPEFRRVLLREKEMSIVNKMWLVQDWQHRGYYIDIQWKKTPFHSRLAYRFGPEDKFVQGKDYEHDVKPFLKWLPEGKLS